MRPTARILNRLLQAEYASLAKRLLKAEAFVGWAAADDRAWLRKTTVDEQDHERELVEMILRLRSVPAPPRIGMETGAVHYLRLAHLMPAVAADLRRLISTYESAGATGNATADTLVQRILGDHRRRLAELERLHGSSV